VGLGALHPPGAKADPVEGHQAFLSSDFTYADLGMVDLHSSFKLLGEEQKNGVRAYKIEEVPRSNWYYSRIVDWVDASSSFPLERDFYDPSNTLWKVETFEQVTAIDGVPTVLKRRMEDRQAGGNTVIDTSEVRYGADVPDSLFDSSRLPQAIDWGWK
jgi:Outer membrane lipoprotein-sorting protein